MCTDVVGCEEQIDVKTTITTTTTTTTTTTYNPIRLLVATRANVTRGHAYSWWAHVECWDVDIHQISHHYVRPMAHGRPCLFFLQGGR